MNDRRIPEVRFLLRVVLAGIGGATLFSGCDRKPEASTKGGGGNKPAPAAVQDGAPSASDGTAAKPLTPETLPVPEGAKLVLTVSDTRTIVLRGGNDFEKIRTHFETGLAALGWKKDEAKSEVIDGVAFLEFNNGGLHITVTLNPSADGKEITSMVQGSGVEVPKEKEANDSDNNG
jgi:hypothetical protein